MNGFNGQVPGLMYGRDSNPMQRSVSPGAVNNIPGQQERVTAVGLAQQMNLAQKSTGHGSLASEVTITYS